MIIMKFTSLDSCHFFLVFEKNSPFDNFINFDLILNFSPTFE
jgi:hypothetical protein